MTNRAPLPPANSRTPRRCERRQEFGVLLTTLSHALERAGDIRLLRTSFEDMLRRVVPARTIRLHDGIGRWTTQPPTAGSRESIALEVPGHVSGKPGLLEATFDPECRLGEWDFQFLTTAAHLASLVLEIERVRALVAARTPLPQRLVSPGREVAAPLVGSSLAMVELRSTIERVAATDFTVLLEGESGVGKELVARQIHEASGRRNGPFVAINCAALVETLLEAELFGIEERTATGVRGRRGKFEAADGGTLFLDEVSDLSPSAQAKLLRAIQDLAVERVGGNGARRVDIRIIVATNRSLAGLVDRKLFRHDLYYRLSGVDVIVPALRDRREDIIELAHHFLERHRSMRRLGLSSSAGEALTTYHWPGNVRELERVIERLVALAPSETIGLDDLPAAVRGGHVEVLGPSLARNETLRAWGSRYARLIVDRCNGNKRKSCRVLGISYHTLQAYLRYPVHLAPTPERPGWAASRTEQCHPTEVDRQPVAPP